jgi:sarcosine oxidase
MKPKSWDAIVVGLGAVGSAAVYQLARRGVRVLGVDRFHPPHDLGSSHGETRITRLAVGEGEEYVPLVRRSHAIWQELEQATGRTLLRSVGGLFFGPGGERGETHGAADFLETTIRVAARHGIPHEILDATALEQRFPQFRYRGDEVGYYEPEAGFVHPEDCIAAQFQEARRLGAELRLGQPVEGWRETGSGGAAVDVGGRMESAERLILCAGAWMGEMVPELAPRLQVYRQVLGWFEPEGAPELFSEDRLPVFIRVPGRGESMFYGFPSVTGGTAGVKVATEQFETLGTADRIGPEVDPGEPARLHAVLAPHLRISPRCVRAVACKYTVTAGFRFLIDRMPGSDRVWVASACSGHGFKHSAAVGEALAEMSIGGRPAFGEGVFRWQRAGVS